MDIGVDTSDLDTHVDTHVDISVDTSDLDSDIGEFLDLSDSEIKGFNSLFLK